MMVMGHVIKKIVAVVMIGYLSKAMPNLPVKLERILSMPIAKMVFVGGLMYLNSGDAIVSAVSALILFAAVYLIRMVLKEPFEPVDMQEIENNELYSDLQEKMTASESINSMLADITEKASDVKNFYLEQCQCEH